jgi:hypothetical protein
MGGSSRHRPFHRGSGIPHVEAQSLRATFPPRTTQGRRASSPTVTAEPTTDPPAAGVHYLQRHGRRIYRDYVAPPPRRTATIFVVVAGDRGAMDPWSMESR